MWSKATETMVQINQLNLQKHKHCTVLRHLWLINSTEIHARTCHGAYMYMLLIGELAHIYSNNCSLSEFPWRCFHGVGVMANKYQHSIEFYIQNGFRLKMMENQECPVDFVSTFYITNFRW